MIHKLGVIINMKEKYFKIKYFIYKSNEQKLLKY